MDQIFQICAILGILPRFMGGIHIIYKTKIFIIIGL